MCTTAKKIVGRHDLPDLSDENLPGRCRQLRHVSHSNGQQRRQSSSS